MRRRGATHWICIESNVDDERQACCSDLWAMEMQQQSIRSIGFNDPKCIDRVTLG